MKKEIDIELLKKVRPTEAPPWLYTRIQAHIRRLAAEQAPGWWSWAGGLAFAALLCLNFFAWRQAGTRSVAENLAISLQLQPSNQLYDE